MSRKPCEDIPIRRAVGGHNDSCSKRGCDPGDDSFESGAWGVQIECRTVDAGYQYDVWNNDSQKSICLATAPLEVLEKVP